MSRRERRTSAALQKRKDRKIAELRIDLKRRDGNIAGTIDKFVTVCRENVQEKGGTPTLQSVTATLKDNDLLVEMCAAIGRLGWKGATAETALDVLAAEVMRGTSAARMSALALARLPYAKRAVQLSNGRIKFTADLQVMEGTIDEMVDTMGRYTALLVNNSNDDNDESLRMTEYARKAIDKLADTNGFRARLVDEGWHGVDTKTVDDELVREIVNRADLRLMIIFAHATADQCATAGLLKFPKDPRKVGLENAFALHEGGLDMVRDTLVKVGWRGAEDGDEVDMRFGRLVTERAQAQLKGTLDFCNEALLRKLSSKDQKIAENAFQDRAEADYAVAKPGLTRVSGFITATRNDQGELDELVDRMLSQNVAGIRERYKDGWPEDIDAAARALTVSEDSQDDWHWIRQKLIESGWQGVTPDTVDLVVSKRLLVNAAKFDATVKSAALMLDQGGKPDLANRLRAATAKQETPGAPPSLRLPSPPEMRVAVSPREFDEMCMRWGTGIWEDTYKVGMSDEVAHDHIDRRYAPAKPGAERGGALLSMAKFSGKWAVHAFQRLQTSHSFGDAMMATTTKPECFSDLGIPWKAFMVHVPNGRLVVSDGDRKSEIARILVTLYDHRMEMHLVSFPGEVWWSTSAPTLTELLDDSNTKPATAIERARFLAKRLVVGLLFAMQASPSNVRERSVKAHRAFREGARVDEPEHRITIIGHPLQVDVREAIDSYIATGRYERVRSSDDEGSSVKRGPPIVQSYVTPHRTHQPYGPRSSLRKIMWIEGYWRGPKDAPVLTRPRRFVKTPEARAVQTPDFSQEGDT